MVLIPQQSDASRRRKGMPSDLQQPLQGSLRRIPNFLIILCGIQASIILIVCIVIATHFFPGQPAGTPPVHPTHTPGKPTSTARPRSFHPALIEIDDYMIAVTVFPYLVYQYDMDVLSIG